MWIIFTIHAGWECGYLCHTGWLAMWIIFAIQLAGNVDYLCHTGWLDSDMHDGCISCTSPIIQLNIDYPTTSGQTTVRRCSDKANVLDKKKLSLTHFQWLLLAARPFYFLLFKIFVFFEWLTTCTVRTPRHVRPKKLLRIIEWSDSRCADNRCSTVPQMQKPNSVHVIEEVSLMLFLRDVSYTPETLADYPKQMPLTINTFQAST